MPTVDLIYDDDCPNVEATRRNLAAALTGTGAPHGWREWNRADPDLPARLRGYGSPTVLINGCDAGRAKASAEANCCRVYALADGGLSGVPPVDTLVSLLTAPLED